MQLNLAQILLQPDTMHKLENLMAYANYLRVKMEQKIKAISSTDLTKDN